MANETDNRQELRLRNLILDDEKIDPNKIVSPQVQAWKSC